METLLPIETLVGSLAEARAARLAADKVAEELKHKETVLKTQLIEAMQAQNLSVAGNAKVFFTLRTKTREQVVDWESFYEYIKQNDAFDLLQRRVNEAAIREREGEVPGVEQYEYPDLSFPQKVKS
jgi:hypothetical protein